MKQYRYVLVAGDGASYDLSRKEACFTEESDLGGLLEQGWRPVRETPIGHGQWYVGRKLMEYPVALILLEKDAERPDARAGRG
jgi:hypothetical protein